MTLIVSAPRPTISSVTINDHPSRTLIQTNLYDRVMVIPNRLDYALLPLNIAQQIGASNSPPTISDTNPLDKVVYVSVDDQLVYARFFADFGPLDLGQTVRFCRDMTSRLSSDCPITLISSDHPHKHTNVMTLLVIFLVICHQHTPEQAISLFRTQRPPFGFRDAAYGICSFFISVLDCARAIYKAIQCNVWSYEMFALEEYEHYDQLVHGDINWIIPGKVLAFSGPQRERIVLNAKGATTLLVSDYVKIFKELGVTCVVRFNEPSTYDRNEFLHANIQHLDLEYPDGGNPPDNIMLKFIQTCERTTGAIAVHCKAGLGRTGTNIAAFMIKKYQFTALEAIAWCRICRPGSIVGPQQQYLAVLEQQLQQVPSNELHKKVHKNNPLCSMTRLGTRTSPPKPSSKK